MNNRDWSSTEFIASAITIVGVWTAGITSGADPRMTFAATTILAVVYVVAKGVQNRQSSTRAWTRSEFAVAAGQIVAVAAASVNQEVSMTTSLVALGLVIASYILSYLLGQMGGRPSGAQAQSLGSFPVALISYDPPLRYDATLMPRPSSLVRDKSKDSTSTRIDRSKPSTPVYASSKTASQPLLHTLRPELLAQFVEARTGEALPDRSRTIDRLESGLELHLGRWMGTEETNRSFDTIAYDGARARLALIDGEFRFAEVTVRNNIEKMHVTLLGKLTSSFGIRMQAQRLGSDTVRIGVAWADTGGSDTSTEES